MISAVSSASASYYTALAHNSAMNMMSLRHSYMRLLSSPMLFNPNFGSLGMLCALDTQYELDMINNSLQYKLAQAILEQIRKQQKEDAQSFSTFA